MGVVVVKQFNRPFLFYFLSLVIPWSFWFAAAYFSKLEPPKESYTVISSVLGFLGLLAPTVIAFWLIFRNPLLKRDFLGRVFNFTAAKPIYYFLTVFLMLASILVAQAISLLFGYSPSQFAFAESYSFSSGVFPVWFLLVAAPLIEELAWHSYGTDTLRSRFNLLNTCLIFALFWGIWHIPLAMIKDYYQSNVVAGGWIHSVNFLLSIFPFVIIMNWLYYKTGRNIIVPIVFHITAGLFNEMFATDPDSKVIQTGVLIVVAVYIVWKDWDFFVNRDQVAV